MRMKKDKQIQDLEQRLENLKKQKKSLEMKG